MSADLWDFTARQSGDEVKRDLELIHEPCGEHVCDIQHGDSIATLAAVAEGHTCQATP